jgi:hypothetical protein
MAISLSVVETGSLTAAARVMSTTMPSASKSLADPSEPFDERPRSRLCPPGPVSPPPRPTSWSCVFSPHCAGGVAP